VKRLLDGLMGGESRQIDILLIELVDPDLTPVGRRVTRHKM
jgi:hypothetical protein